MTDSAPPELLAPMRRLLIVAGVLVVLAGVQLFVFSERTERFFAWTVDPPLTAAFLGAAYWSSAAFEFSAARRRTWIGARIAVPTVFVFTVLTLVVTVVHLGNFHLGGDFEPGTRAVTWAWIVIYAVVPVLMAVIGVRQERVGRDGEAVSLGRERVGRDGETVSLGHTRTGGAGPPRTVPLPRWLRAVVGAQALVLLALGAGLLVAPLEAAAAWPWTLTALTGRAVGAWLVSLGVAAAHALLEDDAPRLVPAATAYLAFGVLQTVALIRYPGDFDWTGVPGVGYLVLLVSAVLVGGVTLRLSAGTRRPRGASAGAPA